MRRTVLVHLSCGAMPVSTIVLPSAAELDRGELLGELGRRGVRVVDVDLPSAHPAPFATRVCAAIGAARPAGGFIVVVPPASVGALPAVALAQRSARRRVIGYAILEPGLINARDVPTGLDWPDAPVTCLSVRVAEPAWVGLRGWHGLTLASLSEVASVLARWDETTSFPGADAIDEFG
ncbi:MAG: hypothetical protein ACKN9D_03720 [Actinomycetales bacterium]